MVLYCSVFILSSLFWASFASFVRLNVSFIMSVTTVLKAAVSIPSVCECIVATFLHLKLALS